MCHEPQFSLVCAKKADTVWRDAKQSAVACEYAGMRQQDLATSCVQQQSGRSSQLDFWQHRVINEHTMNEVVQQC